MIDKYKSVTAVFSAVSSALSFGRRKLASGGARLRQEFAAPTRRSAASSGKIRAFSRGYLICSKEFRFEAPDGWREYEVGNWKAFVDPLLPCRVSADDETAVLVLGQPVNSYTDSESRQLGERLLARLRGRELSAIDDIVCWQGGRYVVFATRGIDARVHVDATASRSAFWHAESGRLIVGSHATLVASATGDTSTKKSKWYLSHPEYESPAGKWLPGTVCPHDAVNMIFANCCLEFSEGKATHRRFYPVTGRKLPDLAADEAARVMIEETKVITRAALQRGGEPYVALTTGSDSYVMLRSALQDFKAAGVIAVTYHKFESNPEHSKMDLLGANRRALSLGVPHLILNLVAASNERGFLRAYRETFKGWSRFPSLACLFAKELRNDGVLFLGIGPEIGTAFYQKRDKPLSGSTLAEKFTQSKFSENAVLADEFDRYILYTELDKAQYSDIDFYDLYYWESRLSSWAAGGYSEYELAIDVALPFNSRKIFEAMLSLPFEERKRKEIYAAAMDLLDSAEQTT